MTERLSSADKDQPLTLYSETKFSVRGKGEILQCTECSFGWSELDTVNQPGSLISRDDLENPPVYFSHTVIVETDCFILDEFCQVPSVKVGIHTAGRKLRGVYYHLFSGEFSNLQFSETSQNNLKFFLFKPSF